MSFLTFPLLRQLARKITVRYSSPHITLHLSSLLYYNVIKKILLSYLLQLHMLFWELTILQGLRMFITRRIIPI